MQNNMSILGKKNIIFFPFTLVFLICDWNVENFTSKGTNTVLQNNNLYFFAVCYFAG